MRGHGPEPCAGCIAHSFNDPNDRVEHIELWSMDGRLVRSTSTKDAVIELDLSAHPAGRYMLRARTRYGAHHASVVVRQ